jgi:ParB family chromosome partitioning protein
MSNKKIVIRSAKERRFTQIPIDKITVVNSRRRDEERFKETVRSIAEVGQQKPICVNERKFKRTSRYELVCGEGRLEAARHLGWTHIWAEVINVEDEHTLLAGLAENLTRSKKDVIDFARRIVQMYERGMSYNDLVRITGKSESTIKQYITLMQKGEERLIRGIEEEHFTIEFAMQVIECTDEAIRNLLMDEHLNGRISRRDVAYIKKILDERAAKGLSNKDMTFTKLRSVIKEKQKEYKQLYAQNKIKRDDAIGLEDCVKTLWKDEYFCEMVEKLKLQKPELSHQHGN